MEVKKAIIAAAGLGTRFLSATKAIPKEMFPVVDTPIIEKLVRELSDAGIEKILIIISKDKESIKKHFSQNKYLENRLLKEGKMELYKRATEMNDLAHIEFIEAREPKGFADAISYGERFVNNEPFMVMVGDELFYNEKDSGAKQLIDCFNIYQNSVIAVKKVPLCEVKKYGNVSGTQISQNLVKVNNLIEKPKENQEISDLVAIGKYIFMPCIFDYIKKADDKLGEKNLTECLKLMSNNEGLYALTLQGKRYDTGDKLTYLETCIEYALRDEKISNDFKDYLKNLCKEI
jgi:UTP--glucose-1-phosphate uridylyltransferase